MSALHLLKPGGHYELYLPCTAGSYNPLEPVILCGSYDGLVHTEGAASGLEIVWVFKYSSEAVSSFSLSMIVTDFPTSLANQSGMLRQAPSHEMKCTLGRERDALLFLIRSCTQREHGRHC